jgi:predicted ABC-type ATPase
VSYFVRLNPDCPDQRPWGVMDVDGNCLGCYASRSSAARGAAELYAYREDQERDDRGRFTEEGRKEGEEKWKEKGEEAWKEHEWKGSGHPWDVDGDTVHFHNHLGVDRADMPQISGTLVDGRYAPSAEMMPKFLERLRQEGVKTTPGRVPSGSIAPTQTTGSMKAIRGITDDLASGKIRDTKPVLISSDGRLLDGHHQWAAHALGESEGTRTGTDPGVPAIRIDLPSDQALEEVRRFANSEGIASRRTGESANPAFTSPRAVPRAPLPADTLEKYTRPDGTIDPDRAKLHRQIIDKILTGHASHPIPVATFLGGGPAAGKSTIATRGEDSAHIDPDEIKAQIPEYQQMVAAGDPRAAMYVHEESSQISKEAMEEARRQKMNYTLDGTGNSHIEKLAKKVNAAKAAGYQTVGKYVTVDTDTAVQRAMQRASETGRMVPEPVIRETHAAVSRVFPEAVNQGLFNNLELWDTNGNKPQRIATASGAFLNVENQEAYQKFLDKGKAPVPA